MQFAEHQDWGLQRRLRLLRAVRSLFHGCRARRIVVSRKCSGRGPARALTGCRPVLHGRGVRVGSEKFERVLEIVREVSQLGMEVCVTLGEIGSVEARKLKAAGVTAYNHNIDTSPEFYPEIVSTHTFQNRLDTIAAVQESGMSVCCGGIIGMGESEADRLRMLEVLSNFDPPPESVPINCLMAMPGTPLADQPPVDIFELVRLIAVTRIALPRARVRLAAGRTKLSREGQALCFFAGANSIFYGNKLLTAKNPAAGTDVTLLRELGLHVESMTNDECLMTRNDPPSQSYGAAGEIRMMMSSL